MKIIRQRERKTIVKHLRMFDWEDEAGSGFAFRCDEKGQLQLDVHRGALANYAACLGGEVNGRKVVDRGVLRHEHSYIEPAVGLCERCGEEVELTGFTNCCSCGADYNMSGQLLAPRSQWGWETGESVADILMADVCDPWEEPS